MALLGLANRMGTIGKLRRAAASSDLLRDPLTSLSGWTTVSGSPVMADGVFSGGAVSRNLGAAMGNIKAALGTTIEAGSSATIIFCLNAAQTEYYRLGVNEISWRLYKGLTLLGTYTAQGTAGNTIEINIDPTTGLDVLIDGVSQLTDPDTAYVANTYLYLQATGATGNIAIYPAESALVVT